MRRYNSRYQNDFHYIDVGYYRDETGCSDTSGCGFGSEPSFQGPPVGTVCDVSWHLTMFYVPDPWVTGEFSESGGGGEGPTRGGEWW